MSVNPTSTNGDAYNQVYKAKPDIEHRQHTDEKSSDSDGPSEITWTEAEEKVVRNKIDWVIVPLVSRNQNRSTLVVSRMVAMLWATAYFAPHSR